MWTRSHHKDGRGPPSPPLLTTINPSEVHLRLTHQLTFLLPVHKELCEVSPQEISLEIALRVTLGDVLHVWDGGRQENSHPAVPLHCLTLDKVVGEPGQGAFSTTVNLQTIYPNKGQHGEREIQGKQMNKQDQLWWGVTLRPHSMTQISKQIVAEWS